jgi:dihydroorotate dehydrogenase (fumarate)
VKAQVSIPVSVKLAPYFTAMANMAQRLDRAGADALVLFNRFYQPDFDLETLEVAPHLVLSTPDELGLRLHWTALLSSCVRSQLAVTGGVHSSDDVAKSILAGAHVVMLASSLLKNGVGHIQTLERGLTEWMAAHEYESVNQMRGAMNIASVALPTAFERANYLKTLSSYTLG